MGSKALISFDHWAADWCENQKKVPGLAVCVRGPNGKTILNEAYGVSDKDSGEALKTNVLFPIASQSKTFMAVAILKLVSEGRVHPETKKPLNLDNHVIDLLPENFHVDWLQGITLRDVLQHNTRAGGSFYPADWNTRSPSPDELRNFNLASITPAEKATYSNSMYDVLGLVIADVSGKTFNDYLRQDVIGNREIYPSLNAIPQDLRGRIPYGYSGDDKLPLLHDFGCGSPSAGFYATPEALTGFVQDLATTEKILPRAIVDEMFTGVPKRQAHYGLGVEIDSTAENDLEGNKNQYFIPGEATNLIGHTGGFDGYRSGTHYDVRTGHTVFVGVNRYYAPPPHPDPVKEEEIKQRMAGEKETSTSKVVVEVLGDLRSEGRAPAPARSLAPRQRAHRKARRLAR